MKRIPNKLTLIAMLLGIFISSTGMAQEEKAHEIRIKIQKEIEGKMKKIDTILRLHEDSLRTYWYSLDHERLDSLSRTLHKKIELVHRKHLKKIQEEVKRVHPEIERLRDSMERHRVEVIIPRMHKLDSLGKHELDIHLKDLDSLHQKMIIRIDSLRLHDMDIDTDSIWHMIRKSLRHLDSLDIGQHLRDLDLQGHIQEGLRHTHIWIDEEGVGSDGNRNGTDLKYLNGKVLKIQTDSRGAVVRVIILSPDGETLEVKEGREAREFMTQNGEKVEISSTSNSF